MRKIFKLLVLIVVFNNLGTTLYSQCGLTQQEQKMYGWTCDHTNGYIPTGSPTNPIMLPEAQVYATGIPIYYPFYGRPAPAFPVIFIPVTDKNIMPSSENAPLPGDPIKCPEIAPSNEFGNYAGGMYGKTRTDELGNPKMHNGYDILAQPGTDFYSMYGGQVTAIEAGFSPGQYARISFGNYITVKSTINGKQYSILYAHLNGIANNLKVGSTISQGQFLGKSGATGNAANVPFKHLHIEVKDEDNKRIDPKEIFNSKFDPLTGKSDKCNLI